MSILLFSILFFYMFLLSWLAVGYIRTPLFYLTKKTDVPVTIIICARNEESRISDLLNTLLAQHYDLSLVQLLLINDASNDNTLNLARVILDKSEINHIIISNMTHQGKKQSIMDVMPHAINDLVIMRDADTYTHSPLWLSTITSFYEEKKSDLIIAPVALKDERSVMWALQAIENNVLAVITCGSASFRKPFLCNGANLAFTKSLFAKTNGYTSHLHIPSGDDILFLEEAKKVPGVKIDYLKSSDAIVHTYGAPYLFDLVSQKIRWASKLKINRNPINFLLAIFTFGVNLCWLMCVIALIMGTNMAADNFLFVVLKLLVDILLLFLSSSLIKNKSLAWYVLPVSFLYPLYACFISVASLIMKPSWKK